MLDNQGDNFVERRLFPRYAVRYLAKVYLNEEMLCGTVINISEGGVGILLPKIIPVGDVLTLGIRNIIQKEEGEEEDKEMKFKAKIAWLSEESTDGMYRGGLEITDISEEILEKLIDHIQYLDDQTS